MNLEFFEIFLSQFAMAGNEKEGDIIDHGKGIRNWYYCVNCKQIDYRSKEHFRKCVAKCATCKEREERLKKKNIHMKDEHFCEDCLENRAVVTRKSRLILEKLSGSTIIEKADLRRILKEGTVREQYSALKKFLTNCGHILDADDTGDELDFCSSSLSASNVGSSQKRMIGDRSSSFEPARKKQRIVFPRDSSSDEEIHSDIEAFEGLREALEKAKTPEIHDPQAKTHYSSDNVEGKIRHAGLYKRFKDNCRMLIRFRIFRLHFAKNKDSRDIDSSVQKVSRMLAFIFDQSGIELSRVNSFKQVASCMTFNKILSYIKAVIKAGGKDEEKKDIVSGETTSGLEKAAKSFIKFLLFYYKHLTPELREELNHTKEQLKAQDAVTRHSIKKAKEAALAKQEKSETVVQATFAQVRAIFRHSHLLKRLQQLRIALNSLGEKEKPRMADYMFLMRFCFAVIGLYYAQRPSIAANMTVSEWLARKTNAENPDWDMVKIANHKTKATRPYQHIAIRKSDARFFDLYYMRCRQHIKPFPSDKAARKSDEPLFITFSTSNSIIAHSSDFIRQFQQEIGEKRIFTVNEVRHIVETESGALFAKTEFGYKKGAVCEFLGHTEKIADTVYRSSHLPLVLIGANALDELECSEKLVQEALAANPVDFPSGDRSPSSSSVSSSVVANPVVDLPSGHISSHTSIFDSSRIPPVAEGDSDFLSEGQEDIYAYLRKTYILNAFSPNKTPTVSELVEDKVVLDSLAKVPNENEKERKAIMKKYFDHLRLTQVRLRIDYIIEEIKKKFNVRSQSIYNLDTIDRMTKLSNRIIENNNWWKIDFEDRIYPTIKRLAPVPRSKSYSGAANSSSSSSTPFPDPFEFFDPDEVRPKLSRMKQIPVGAPLVSLSSSASALPISSTSTISSAQDTRICRVYSDLEILNFSAAQNWPGLMIKLGLGERGAGVFSSQSVTFGKGQIICDYFGYFRKLKDHLKRLAELKESNPAEYNRVIEYSMEVKDVGQKKKVYVIEADEDDNSYGRIINHTPLVAHANVCPELTKVTDENGNKFYMVLFKTCAEIQPNQELLFCYGEKWKDASWYNKCPCPREHSSEKSGLQKKGTENEKET